MLAFDVALVQGAQELSGEVSATVFTGARSMARHFAEQSMGQDPFADDSDEPTPGQYLFSEGSQATATLDGQQPVRGHLDATGLVDVTGARIDIAADFRC